MRKTTLPFLLALAIAAPVIGCGDGTVPTGDLRVEYRIGSGTSGCTDAGIARLRFQVLKRDDVVASETIDCAPTNQTVLLLDIDRGTYDVKVEGTASNGNVIYAGTLEDVRVEGDVTNGPVTVVISQILPSLMLWFDFEEIGNCARFEVEKIRIVVYKDGSSPIHDTTVDCAVQLDDSLLIEGLSDTAFYDLRVRGTNANDEYTYEFNENGITVTAGPPTERTVVLKPCTGFCTAP